MKKLLIAAALFFGLTVATSAQTATPKKDPKAKTTKTVDKDKSTTAVGPLKKDGTADKRFKANKDAKPAAGPLKKDGTPDMRYKANKDAAKKKS